MMATGLNHRIRALRFLQEQTNALALLKECRPYVAVAQNYQETEPAATDLLKRIDAVLNLVE